MNNQFTEFAQRLTPDIYHNIKRALELGKWPDGRSLTEEQKQTCMQAVISFEAANLPEQQRTGFMPQHCASKGGDQQTIATDRDADEA